MILAVGLYDNSDLSTSVSFVTGEEKKFDFSLGTNSISLTDSELNFSVAHSNYLTVAYSPDPHGEITYVADIAEEQVISAMNYQLYNSDGTRKIPVGK